MRQFKSLKAQKLPAGLDARIHGEEPIVEISELKKKIIISYSFPGFYLVDDTKQIEGETIEFKQVSIAKVGHLAESGKPLLPSFGRYVQIPFGTECRIKVEKSEPVEFDNVLVLPAQEHITDDPKVVHAFEYNKDLYGQNSLYPEDLVRVSEVMEIDGYHAVLVHVCPFQYSPAMRHLIGYGNVTVTMDIVKRKSGIGTAARIDVDREAFGNLFLNPGRGIEERLGVEIPFPFVRPSGSEFLILHYKSFKKAAEKLALWKNRRGLLTETVSIDAIGNEVGKIKDYLRARRGKIGSRLRYVLLLGDSDMITPEETNLSPWGGNASDYYYSTKDDPSDSQKLIFPWLSIGRIPVRTAAEALEVVDQIIAYERKPPADAGYYQRMIFAAFFQEDDMPGNSGYGMDDRGYLKTLEDIRSHIVTLGFSVQRVYVSNNPAPQFYNDGTPIPDEVMTSFVDGATATEMLINGTTEGQLIIAHRDHGDFVGWSHPKFQLSDLDGISGEMPTLFFSINCLTGQFDAGVAESFAEKNLRMAGTAPSLVAATRVSHTWLNNYLIKALFDALFGGMIQTFPAGTASYPIKWNRLGDILNYAKSYLPTVSSDTDYIKDHFEIYHVVGDPTLEVWNEEPQSMKVRAVLRQNMLDIQLSSCPKGSVMTLWYGAKMLKRMEPSSTHITLSLKGIIPPVPLPGLVKQPLYVCVWAPGYRYREIRVMNC